MNRKTKGFTLLELIIAMAVLLIVMVPMFNIFFYSSRNNALAYHIKTATLIAQQRIEEFVGLKVDFEVTSVGYGVLLGGENQIKSFLNEYYNESSSDPALFLMTDGVYTIEAGVEPAGVATAVPGGGITVTGENNLPLVSITVSVSYDGSVLCTQNVLINAAPGGIIN